MNLFTRARDVADRMDATVAMTAAALERGVDAVVRETEELAAAAVDDFDKRAEETLDALSDYEQKLIAEIERKNAVLAKVKETIDRLRSIAVDPGAASAKLSSAGSSPTSEPHSDSTGAAPATPPVAAS